MKTLTLSGSFDFPTAKALLAAVVSTPETSPVQVDFSQVSEFSDVALAGLGAWLSRRRRKVSAVGLRDPELRLLDELGLGDAFAKAA